MKDKPNLKELEKAFNGDLDLVLFFLSWVKNARNATKAYLELNPHVDPASAATLGSRQLKKVEIGAVLEQYGAGFDSYFQQIADGHKAMKWNDFTGEREADHKVRGDYSKRIGKLLGVETDSPTITNEVKILVIPQELAQKYELKGEDAVTPDSK